MEYGADRWTTNHELQIALIRDFRFDITELLLSAIISAIQTHSQISTFLLSAASRDDLKRFESMRSIIYIILCFRNLLLRSLAQRSLSNLMPI